MMRQRIGVVILVAVVTLVSSFLFADEETPAVMVVTVVRVHDGDTFTVEYFDNDMQTIVSDVVRMIGIDTPEMKGPKALRTQPYAIRAWQYLETIILNHSVLLEKEISDRDVYGRLLRHVYLVNEAGEKGQSVGEAMVIAGYATANPMRPNIGYAERFAELDQQAHVNGVGRWHRRTKKKLAPVTGERSSFAFFVYENPPIAIEGLVVLR